MSGYIKLYRDILGHRMWQNKDESRMFIYLLLSAHHGDKPRQLGPVLVKRGQFLRSYRNIREDLMYFEEGQERRYSLGKIKRLIESLKDEITCEETRVGTLFSILNYARYQDKPEKNEEARNSNGTGTEQPRNNNKKGENNNSSPNGEAQSATHPVWGDALQMLIDAGEKEQNARAFLGRALRDHEEGAVNDAISACILAQPVNPKAFLMAQLKPVKKKTYGTSVPGAGIQPAGKRQLGVVEF